MAQNAEKLIILNDIGNGLLNRLYNLVFYENADLFTKEVTNYTSSLAKKFPLFPDNLNKGSNYEAFYKRASEIQTELRNFYNTFLDVLNFSGEAWKLIVEMASMNFSWEMNPDIMGMFFTLFVTFTKVHMLVARVEKRKFYLAAYTKAHQCSQGNHEPNLQKLSEYLLQYEKPLLHIRSMTSDISDQLCNVLIPFHMTLVMSSDASAFIKTKHFNVLDDQKNMHRPHNELELSKIMHVNDFREWVLYTFLVCPKGLQRPEARNMLTACLSHNFVIKIHRNITFQPCAAYVTLFDTFKLNKLNLKKHKKCVKDAYTEWEKTIALHAVMRTYLRVTCSQLLSFFKEFSPAIAPKIMMLLAAVRLGRDEVGWYFRHVGNAAPYNNKKKHIVEDPYVSDLIFYVHSITDLLRTHMQSVSDYYLSYLSTGVGDKDVQIVADTFRSACVSKGASLGEMSALIDHITAGLAQVSANTSMEAIRLNWYRVSAGASHEHSGIHPDSVSAFSKSLTVVMAHTRMVDALPAQIKIHCSFSELYWYQEKLEHAFDACLRSTGTARNSMSFVRLLNNAMHNIHLRIAPEEQRKIGIRIAAQAKKWLKQIVAQIQKLVEHVSIQANSFRAQSGHRAVVQGLASGDIKMFPGEESSFANRDYVKRQRLWKKAISELVSAVHHYDRLTVFNVELVPREYLIDQITRHFRSYLRDIVKGQRNDKQEFKTPAEMPYFLTPPVVILNRVNDFIMSYQNVEHYININISEITRSVMMSEFSMKVGGLGEPVEVLNSLKMDEYKSKEQPIAHYIAEWYRQVFYSAWFEKCCTYSQLNKCFQKNAKAKPAAMDIARYTDVLAMRALSTLLGPNGLRTMESYLLQIIVKRVETIKTSLSTYKTTLDNLTNQFSHREEWKRGCQSFEELDFVVLAAINLGSILQFRLDLRDAHGKVMNRAAPFVQQSVGLACDHLRSKVGVFDNQFKLLDGLAADVGLTTGLGDSTVRHALLKYCAHQSDYDLFNLLPELFGIAFVSKTWRNAEYQIKSMGHNNNAHCLALCINSLIVATKANANMARNVSSKEGYNLNDDITAALQRFIKNASYSLLHLNAEGGSKNYRAITHMMGFLEILVQHSDGRVEMAYLEECFPFAFVRQNFILIYEEQTSLADRTNNNAGEETKEDN